MSGCDPSVVASDPAHSAWVAANAGSGKTYTLANRVTRLLLDDSKPERILCLTFTKAAAAEMQARLFTQLGTLAMLPDAELAKRLASICGVAPPAADWTKARRLFARALETPGGLKIQTLHGFCQSVLGRFPLEAAVAPSFRVLDEQDSSALIAEARVSVLERAGSGDALIASAIARLVTEVSEVTLSEILKNSLGTDRRKVERYLQSAGPGDAALARAVRRAHNVADTDTEDGIVEAFYALTKIEAARLREVAGWMDGGSKTDCERAAGLGHALSLVAPRLVFGGLRRALLKADGEKLQNVVTKKHGATNAALLAFLEKFVDRLYETELRRREAHAAELSHATLSVVDAVRQEYARLKRARGVLDYNDLITETKKLLERGDAAQWVLFKLDGGIDHLLIDEAQDTSPEQWAIVNKLTEEFFVGSSARPEGIVRTIFVVGDEKQSIFSFQGAEPEQFEKYRIEFQNRALDAEREFVNEPLSTSRRSAPEILAFVDEVFSEPHARVGLTREDAEIRHFAHREGAKGRVEFWPAIKPAQEPEPDPQREVDLPSRASAAARLAQRIAVQIREWMDRRVRLPGHEKPIRPGDIMILLPRREPFGPLVIRELKSRGIPVAGADRLRLTDEIAVRDLIALGRFVLQPLDDLMLATLLRSPFCGISDESLLALCSARSGSLWSELVRCQDKNEEFSRAHSFFSDMMSRADYEPPFEFYTHALTACGMHRRILQRLGSEAGDAIEEFLSLAFSYEVSNTPSLEGFLDGLERGDVEIKRDMERGRDEVRVMTVHGAKGLEADIVFLPDTTRVPQTPAQKKDHLLFAASGVYFPLADDRQPLSVSNAKLALQQAIMREHRRLLYVALTRARDQLYVCGFENKRGIQNDSWYRLTEAAAKRLGREVKRNDETILVVGEDGEEHAPEIDRAKIDVPIPAWVSSAPKEPARPRLLRPSDAVDGDEIAASSPRGAVGARRFERGLLVHAMLARLPEIEPAEREASGRRFLRSRVEDEEQREALLAETLAVLGSPDFASAFAVNSRAEVAITAELPELGAGARVNGRVDRLAVSENEVLIVDFKTNRPPPMLESEVARIYLAQMALYRAAVAKIFPNRGIACALVWTDGPRLMPLSDAVLERELRGIATRLDPGGGRS